MNKLLTILFIFIFSLSNSQTLYKSDYVETYDTDWSGAWWTPISTTGYYTNAYVSFNASAVIYGNGSGSSAYESDWYSFPNLTVNPLNEYHFKFRLGSYRFTSTSSTRGVDAAGEEWWMDNFELYEIEYNPLPVELISFTAKNINERTNLLRWSTASEHNSSHFILQRSTTGYFKESDNIGIIQSAGNSTILLDESFERCINYYKLIQEDFDGKRKEYPIIAIDNRSRIKNFKYCIDASGRIVDLETATGLIYVVYEDGTIERIYK